MPSKFPWSKSSAHHANTDLHVAFPRSSSKQSSSAYSPYTSSPDASYNPHADSQEDHSAPVYYERPPSPQVNVYVADNPSATGPVSGQQYDQQPLGEHPPQALPQKKSLRSKLLGAASSSREDVSDGAKESSGLFGRRRSIRKKDPLPDLKLNEPPRADEAGGQWSLAEAQGPNALLHVDRVDQYSSHHAPAHIDTRDPHIAYHPPGEQALSTDINQPRQPHPYQYQAYHNPLREDSGAPLGHIDLPAQHSSDSLPPPPQGPESRPISRQSQERQLSGGQPQQQQYVAYHQDPTPFAARHEVVQSPTHHSPTTTVPLTLPLPGGYDHPPETTVFNTLTAPPNDRSNAQPSPLPAMESNSHSSHGLNPNSAGNRGQQPEVETRSKTPPPPRSASDMTEAEVNQLIRDHREMKQKYNNVKRQYFDKKDQVDTLQNTLAHQRLSQSRTHLDDGEYVARMNRLDGLVSQLAFNMRKDWKTLPDWLQPAVNKDALQIGKQEMTAVGRAFVARWLADEVFSKFFHPSLNADLSAELKTIQKNIRDYAPPFQSAEEEEALAAKVINWRLATVDGLQPLLASQEAVSNKQALIETLSKQLVADFVKHLQEPPPSDLNGGVHMIIELAIGILASLPLESRDVHIGYFMPGQAVVLDLMKIESGIPPLTGPSPPAEAAEGDKASLKSHTSEMKEGEPHTADSEGDQAKTQDDLNKKSFLGGLMGKRAASPHRGIFHRPGSATASQNSLLQANSSGEGAIKEDRVRMATFLSLQVRGKMVLAKAPVFKV